METVALSRMAEQASLEWTWSRVDTDPRTFALRSPTALLAGVRFETGWLRRYRATADVAEARYRLQHRGLLRRLTEIHDATGERVVARIFHGLREPHRLELPGGPTFHWEQSGVVEMESRWETSAGARVVSLHWTVRSAGQARVEAIAGARALPEFPLLVVSAFYAVWIMADRRRRAARS